MSAAATTTPYAEATRGRLAEVLAGTPHQLSTPRDGLPCVEVAREALREVLQRLRERGGFESATFVTGVDRHPAPAGSPRFEVLHQLRSLAHGDRVRVRTRLAEDDAWVPTCVDLWPGASFMERECQDLLGIRFEGHPDPRRLLMPEGYGHHPLRKDFPHVGIRPDRLYREWDAARRADWSPRGRAPA